MDEQLQAPIVFIIFNRPEFTRRVRELIAQARPRRLLVVADGPRANQAGEDLLCEEARQVATQIDWPCRVDTNFADRNLGCNKRIVTGLDWTFGLVDEAIILEDDVLPDPSFFRFCEEMLVRFRDDSRVSMVAGFNIVQRDLRTNYSYFFSRLTHVWGWATWRRAWSRYDRDIRTWPEIKAGGVLGEIFDRQGEIEYWTYILDKIRGGTDTWDYQWEYTNLVNNTLSVVPRVNLIENIGFGPGATHTSNAENAPNVTRHSLDFPLVHPPWVLPLRSMDRRDMDLSGHVFLTPRQRFVRKWKRTFSRLWNRTRESG